MTLLSDYIFNKINNIHHDKNNQKIDISDLIYFPIEDLLSAVDDQVRRIIDRVKENKEYCYDSKMMTLIELCYELRFLPKYNLLDEYLILILDQEKNYPFEKTSQSIIFILVYYIKESIKPKSFWEDLYKSANKNLNFIFACGIFKYDFDFEIYKDVLQKCNYLNFYNSLLECEILSQDVIININNKLPQDVKNKMINDCVKTENKNIVLN